MKSTAYVVPDGSCIHKVGKNNKWFVLRITLDFKGKINGGDMVPFKNNPKLVPSFNIVGTDRESVKNKVCKLIDEIFDNN